MKVTFDSNVWEKLVSESSDYPTIRERILDGSISPYLCEISVSLESIRRLDRQQFLPNYMPIITFTRIPRSGESIEGILQISPNSGSHPGLAQIHLKKLLKATSPISGCLVHLVANLPRGEPFLKTRRNRILERYIARLKQPEMSGQIFISYRRGDAPYPAGRLYDRLSSHFLENQIFMDVDTIEPGFDFVEAIERSVGSCRQGLADFL